MRKETSWKGWCKKELGNDDFKNEPTSGFVLNKGVGGARQSWGWNTRNEYIRIYDPRNFEFEISVSNLLWILQETSSIKGKGLEGEFVYGWYGKELMLIPTCSQEYQECLEYTNLQDGKVSARDLVPGLVYQDSGMTEWIYIGRYLWYDHPYQYTERYHSDQRSKPEYVNKHAKKQHIFVMREHTYSEGSSYPYKHTNTMSSFKRQVTDTPVDNFAFVLDSFLKLKEASPFQKVQYQKITVEELKEKMVGYWGRAVLYENGKGYEFQKHQGSYANDEGVEKNDLMYVPSGKDWHSYSGWGYHDRVKTINYKTISYEEVAERFTAKTEVYENGHVQIVS